MWVANVWAKGYNNMRVQFESDALQPLEVISAVNEYLAKSGEFASLIKDNAPIVNFWEFQIFDIATNKKCGGLDLAWLEKPKK